MEVHTWMYVYRVTVVTVKEMLTEIPGMSTDLPSLPPDANGAPENGAEPGMV